VEARSQVTSGSWLVEGRRKQAIVLDATNQQSIAALFGGREFAVLDSRFDRPK